MRKYLFLFFLLVCMALEIFPQGEIDDEIKEFYRNERTLAFEVNSRGWGFGYRYGKRINGFKKRLYDFSFITHRHLREVKLSYETGRYVYGKLNSLYSLQAGAGVQKEHFGKFDKGGVAIRSVMHGGVCLALVKPYYYIVFNDEGDKEPIRYTSDNTDIYSKAPFLYGVGNTYFLPGIYCRVASNFEFSKTDLKIQAFEIGANAHLYIQEIPLMATDDNSFWFANFYIAYRFGKIIGR